MGGLNYKELSETLNISPDLVKVRLFRARQSILEIAKKFL
jgi:DNA-directed RNA polymerase specialized sigma24 family protein